MWKILTFCLGLGAAIVFFSHQHGHEGELTQSVPPPISPEPSLPSTSPNPTISANVPYLPRLAASDGADEFDDSEEPIESRAPESTSTQDTVKSFTIDDRIALEANLDSLFATADENALREAYRAAAQRTPEDFCAAAHAKKLANGEFVVLGMVQTAADGSTQIPPNKSVSPSNAVLGQRRVHMREDGTVVETVLEFEELGKDAALAVELTWFQNQMATASRR